QSFYRKPEGLSPPFSRSYFHQSNLSFKSLMSVCPVPTHHPDYYLPSKLETKYCNCEVDYPPDVDLIHQESSSVFVHLNFFT
ncbi:MAG: hypothetical protein EZS28_033888, partial [Streblomastix strix]